MSDRDGDQRRKADKKTPTPSQLQNALHQFIIQSQAHLTVIHNIQHQQQHHVEGTNPDVQKKTDHAQEK
ncbi:unnamed protein product [Caenorhabditis angaria]|uniref:Uncharacterized protein n=1 Tax=Caenorhabditis angaria TaxID=860376 RepID=A0A9P1N9I6_9PELO|nr:unnamed protein product [Caenorhabditis angaria]